MQLPILAFEKATNFTAVVIVVVRQPTPPVLRCHNRSALSIEQMLRLTVALVYSALPRRWHFIVTLILAVW